VPRIAVLLPAHNCQRYVRQSLESIRTQTFTDWILVAVDDGSTDGTRAILEEFASSEPRVQVISRPRTGIVGALNDGLARIDSEFVARMDADDFSLPHRLERQLEFLERNRDCVATGCHVQTIDADGDPIDIVKNPSNHEQIEERLFHGDGGALPHPGLFVRRDAIEAIGRYRPETQLAEDVDLYLRLAEVGRLSNVGEVLLLYRLHSQSTNIIRREQQRLACARAIEDACRRRSLPSRQWESSARLMLPLAEQHATWAYRALAAGNDRTARKHAAKALLLAPWKGRYWALAGACAVRSLNFPRGTVMTPAAERGRREKP